MNPTVRLKVPAGLMAKAVHDKKKTPIIYYYAAKSFRSNGLFKRGELVSHLIEKTGKSRPAVKNNVAKLIKLGWITKTPKGLQLASYDLVWQELGFDTAVDHLGLMYVSPEQDFWLASGVQEIAKNQVKQAREIEKFIISEIYDIDRTELKQTTASDLRKKREAARKEVNIREVKLKELKKLRELSIEYTSADNSLTCKSVANIFGRSSSYTGWKMEQKMKEAGLIEVKRRKVEINGGSRLFQLRQDELNSSYWLFKGVIYKQLPNKITVL